MLTIKLTESTNLAFDMIVEGSKSTVDQAWLVFEAAAGYEVRIPAQHANNRVRCAIPVLDGVLPNGPTKVTLEVVVDGRYYRPVSETVQLGKGQDISIITKSLAEEEPVDEARVSTFSQFGTPPKKQRSAHQKEVARKSKEYWDRQPEIEPKDQQVGNAKVVPHTESIAALDQLRATASAEDQQMIATFGSRFNQALEEQRQATDRKVAEARKIAEAMLSGITTQAADNSVEAIKTLLSPKK